MSQMEFMFARELVVDNFAGGGGASTGIEWAFGRSPDIAINHDREAVAMHTANHPHTRHYCEDVWHVDPVEACGGRPVGLAWFSPDCKHFSKAKGKRPVSKRIRGLAWVVVRWAKRVRPRVIMLENVEEFQDWGPVLQDGRPCPARKGQTFDLFVGQLRRLGYRVEWRQLRACDYGAPTIRRRLFLVARCDGRPIVWPKPTHGDPNSIEVRRGNLLPWRTAAECIDWSIHAPSIFARKRPLAENTLRRIARGIQRYVIEASEPFIVKTNHTASYYDYFRGHGIREPLHTVTAQGNGSALVVPYVTEHANGSSQRNMPADEPLRTICAQVKGGHFALVAPTMIQAGYGERPGQAPRAPGLDKPLGTVVAGGTKHALVAAFLAKHYGGNYDGPGVGLTEPASTVTTVDHHALVASSLVKLRGSCRDGQAVDRPAPTVTAGGTHVGEVRAFLLKYYGTDQDPRLGEPLHTVTTKDRFGLVTVHGEDYVIADIGMRMLSPRELYRAQGFPDSYRIDIEHNGKPLSKAAQVRMVGNSVVPHLARALVEANVGVQTRGGRIAA